MATFQHQGGDLLYTVETINGSAGLNGKFFSDTESKRRASQSLMD